MAVEAGASRRSGLRNLIDTLVSPKETFESLRVVPTWGWALAVAIVLSLAGTYLSMPVMQHLMTSNPEAFFGARAASMTPSQIHAIANVTSFAGLFGIIVLPLAVLIAACVMLLFDKLGHGEGTFKSFFAAQSNIAVVSSLGTFLAGLLMTFRGAAGFSSIRDMTLVMPSLAYLAPGAGSKLSAFLAALTPFTLWAGGLAVLAMLVIGRVPRLHAWLAGATLVIVPAALAAMTAK